MPRTRIRVAMLLVFVTAGFASAWLAAAPPAAPPGQAAYDNIARARAHSMLTQIRDEIRKTYYDPAFRGLDLDAHFKKADEKLDQAKTFNQALAIIAQALLDFDDSHTYFDPPSRTARVEYGFRQQMIGDACFITAVRSGSDAEKKGVKPGDRLLAVQNFKPTRQDLWKIGYFFKVLNPMPGIRITVQSPGGEPRQVDIAARVRQARRNVDLTDLQTVLDLLTDYDNQPPRHRYQRVGEIVVWKMGGFDLEPDEVDEIVKSKLKNASALVLDLRGNEGGAVITLERLVSHFFDRDVLIAERKGRETMEPMLAKKRNGQPFPGRVAVLVDAESGSASEIFARVMQIEKRGVVLGDRSSGAVMQARYFDGTSGAQSAIFFGASITNADVIMTDGKSLEKIGVTPDELLVPTPEDLAADRDPVLSRAIATLGGALDPAQARRLFPVEWAK